jgi:hypothetical protein
VIPAEGSRREADRGSRRHRQARAWGKVPAPAVHSTRLVRLQFSRGHVPPTPGAACTGHGPELWFSDSQPDIAQAKTICQGCQDRVSCLSGAIERRETYGIWGGTDFNLEHHQEDVT